VLSSRAGRFSWLRGKQWRLLLYFPGLSCRPRSLVGEEMHGSLLILPIRWRGESPLARCSASQKGRHAVWRMGSCLANPTRFERDELSRLTVQYSTASVPRWLRTVRVGPKRIEKHTVETGFVKMINQKNQLKPVFNVRFCKPKLKTVLKVWFCKWKMETSSSTTSDFSASGHERGRVGWLVQSNFKRQCAFPTLDGAVGRTVRTTSSTRRVAFGLLYQLISYAVPALRTVACR
jgi:hypothetical protein